MPGSIGATVSPVILRSKTTALLLAAQWIHWAIGPWSARIVPARMWHEQFPKTKQLQAAHRTAGFEPARYDAHRANRPPIAWLAMSHSAAAYNRVSARSNAASACVNSKTQNAFARNINARYDRSVVVSASGGLPLARCFMICAASISMRGCMLCASSWRSCAFDIKPTSISIAATR